MRYLSTFIIIFWSLLVFWSSNSVSDSNKVRVEKSRLLIFEEALTKFKRDVGQYPVAEDGGLLALLKRPKKSSNWHGPYLNYPFIPLDSWGKAYVYQCFKSERSERYIIYSYGENQLNENGLGDDIMIKNNQE